MSAASKQEPKYLWDIDVPGTPFWSDLDYHIGVIFLSSLPSNEIASLQFPDTLPKDQKLPYLRQLLDRTYEEKSTAVAPKSLEETDLDTYKTLRTGQSNLASLAGDYSTAESILLDLKTSPNPEENMNSIYGLAHLYLKMGKYAEAEAAAREALPWIKGKLGTPDSPQTLGLVRGVLVESLWKQGRVEEAREVVREASGIIERMGGGKFGKYVREEREELRRVLAECERVA